MWSDSLHRHERHLVCTELAQTGLVFWDLLKKPGDRYDHKMSTWSPKAERAQFFAPCHCFIQRILGTRPVCQALLDPVEGPLPAQTPTPRDHRYRRCGKRALTADHPPTQLSDVLLCGFFPLKLTPEVGQHAWGHPGTPTVTLARTGPQQGRGYIPGSRVSL